MIYVSKAQRELPNVPQEAHTKLANIEESLKGKERNSKLCVLEFVERQYPYHETTEGDQKENHQMHGISRLSNLTCSKPAHLMAITKRALAHE